MKYRFLLAAFAAAMMTISTAARADADGLEILGAAIIGGYIGHNLGHGYNGYNGYGRYPALPVYPAPTYTPLPNYGYGYHGRRYACETYRVPVYGPYGNIVEYIQHCR